MGGVLWAVPLCHCLLWFQLNTCRPNSRISLPSRPKGGGVSRIGAAAPPNNRCNRRIRALGRARSVRPNTKLTSERRKHNQKPDETRWPKEKALITPERNEYGAADVRHSPFTNNCPYYYNETSAYPPNRSQFPLLFLILTDSVVSVHLNNVR